MKVRSKRTSQNTSAGRISESCTSSASLKQRSLPISAWEKESCTLPFSHKSQRCTPTVNAYCQIPHLRILQKSQRKQNIYLTMKRRVVIRWVSEEYRILHTSTREDLGHSYILLKTTKNLQCHSVGRTISLQGKAALEEINLNFQNPYLQILWRNSHRKQNTRVRRNTCFCALEAAEIRHCEGGRSKRKY